MVKHKKCQFSTRLVKFLGHVVDSSGIQPDTGKVEAILEVKPPDNVGDVCRFLGMVNQMSKFIPNLADTTQPLRELLIKGNQWIWGEPQERAFTKVKELLTSSPVLGSISYGLLCCLIVCFVLMYKSHSYCQFFWV